VTATGGPDRLRPRYGRIAALTGAVVSTVLTLGAGVGLLPGAAAAQAAPDPGGITLASEESGETSTTRPTPLDAVREVLDAAQRSPGVPARSGEGRRVVLDLSDQRVWLVDDGEEVRRTYLVSGSVSDNLKPGSYEVYSRSRQATGIDGSSMDFMVRFTIGDNAPIGFHDIPEMDGEPVQTRAQLGTPLSHGCVRQARPDAVALWRFAPVGTPVVVTA
jgi:lipoprotein-anchoring transpeptidase ErfK/SrfK